MNFMKQSALALCIALSSGIAFAEGLPPLKPAETSHVAASADLNVKKIEEKAKQLFGDIGLTKITRVRDVAEKAFPASAKSTSSMLELYEVKMANGARVYTDANADFWLLSRQGLDFVAANEASNEVININGIADREETLKALKNLGKTIDFKAENEKAAITVFFDVNCGYCNKMFNERQQYLDKGITLKFAAAPIFQGSEQTMSKIWCSPDYASKLVAYEEFTVKRRDNHDLKAPELGEMNNECLSTVKNQGKIAESIGLKGTPLIVLPNGDKLPGYTPAEELSATLSKK
jgi:thiol:disulfide interchange protein DsbC